MEGGGFPRPSLPLRYFTSIGGCPQVSCDRGTSYEPTQLWHLTQAFMSSSFSFSLRSIISATCRAQPCRLNPSQIHTKKGSIAVTRHLISPVATSLSRHARYIHAAPKMETVDTSSRLSELRKLMKERNLDIYGQ